MGLTEDHVRREVLAGELLGEYLIKTAGGLMNTRARKVWNGWIYASGTELLFLSDQDLPAFAAFGPGMIDFRTVKLPLKGVSNTVRSPWYTPNAIIEFSNGVELVAPRKHIKAIARLGELS